MEIQLQELIDQIKKEGLEASEAQAAAKIDEAKAEAERIISEAKAVADEIIKKAKEENERLLHTSEDSIRQAGRNLLISFRESIVRELNALLNDEVNSLYASENLAELIIRTVEALANNESGRDMTLLVNSSDITELEKCLVSKLKEKMLSGVTLKADDSFSGGFRVGIEAESAYYDFSAESVTEMLSVYLNPKVTSLLKEAEKQ